MMRKCYVHLTVKNTAFSGHETFTKILDGVIKFIAQYMEFRIEFLFNRQIKAKKGKHVVFGAETFHFNRVKCPV